MVRLSEDEWSAVQAAPPTTYSLGGSGLDNLITGGSYDPSYDDGLGHYWDSAIQGWWNKSDGSVYSPNQGYDYSADPGLGVYGDQGSYQPPNYSLGFGGSPVTSYTNPDANGDGLNDANGWAVGVIQDYASPTGFSYNGQPTYSNGSPYVENTYQQPGGDWYNYDQYKDSGTGWDTYNLNNPGLSSPDLNYQTPEDAITALRRRGQYVPNDISRADLAARVAALGTPIGDGSFGQGLKDFAGATGTAATDIISAPQKYVGGPLAQAAWDNPGTAISTALNPMAGLQNLGIQSLLNPGGAQDKYQQYYDANQEVLNNPDTNPFLREGYRTLTDPLTYLGPTAAAKLIPGEGTAANVIRSLVDQGGIEAVLGGNLGAVAANTDTAQNIPYFGDQPAWLRGIEGGVIGGLGAAGFAGTLKATAENAGEGGLKRALGQAGEATTPGPEPIDTASLFEKRAGISGRGIPEGKGSLASGPVPPQTNLFGEVADQPVFRGDESPAVMQARRVALDTLQGNREIRRSGITAAEVAAGRKEQVGGILSGYEKAIAEGKTGGELLDASVDGLPSGRIIKTNAGSITPADREALKDVVAQWMSEDPAGRAFEARTARDVLEAMSSPAGYNPQPAEDALLRRILGDDLTDTVSSRLKGANVEGAKVEAPSRPLPLGEQTVAVQPPIESAAKSLSEEERGRQFFDALDAKRKAASDYTAGFADRPGPAIRNDKQPLDLRLQQEAQQLRLSDATLPKGIYRSGTPTPKPRSMTPALITRYARNAFGEAFALPRAIKSSLDLSAPLRQGFILSVRHPKAAAEAFADQIRAMRSVEAARKIDATLDARPNARIHTEAGLYRAPFENAALTKREEAFLTTIAEKLPGIRASERAYVTYLNKLRADSFDSVWNSWDVLDQTSENAKALARFINVASGRGELTGKLEGSGTLLGQVLYSPRYVVSRPQAVWMAATGNGSKLARQEALKSMAAYFGAVGTTLALGKAAGFWDVEMDPRSADFGKAKIGNIRYDLFTGYSQIMRLFAQVESGQTKGTTTGQIYDINRMQPIGRFTRSKLNPTVGFAVDALSGTDYKGDKVSMNPLQRLWDLVAPIQPMETAQAFKDQGWEQGLATLPGFVGIGVQAYGVSDFEKRDAQSQRMFGVPYSQQTPAQRLEFTDKYGKLIGKSDNAQEAANALQQLTTLQGEDDTARDAGTLSPEQWRKFYQDRKTELRNKNDVIYADQPPYKGGDPRLQGYYAAIDASKAGNGGRPDWDKVDAYVASLSPEDAKWVTDHSGYLQIDTPKTRQFEQDYDAIKASGYFERTDKTWDAIKDSFGVSEPDYYKWKDQQVAQTLSMIGGTPEEPGKLAQAESIVAKMPAVKLMEEGVSNWKQQWAISNSDEAYLAWKYGYYDPTKEIKAYLSAKYER